MMLIMNCLKLLVIYCLIIKFIDVSKHQEILDQLNQTFITNNNDDE